jgi:hypothetical protein
MTARNLHATWRKWWEVTSLKSEPDLSGHAFGTPITSGVSGQFPDAGIAPGADLKVLKGTGQR